ncbi:MAG: HD domain-containing protein [Candidatus Andersenbacteria bacterium]|nr:HD domain-containing protein [bacterium]MDZ4225821.1 HD domain-containing protein [Candidatus Andersenbacteria bacterium]
MTIPKEVQTIIEKLNRAGFEAFAVGGCVRDLLLERMPADWDVATSAKPEEIQKLFPKNFYANEFGTVTVLCEGEIKEVEVTTYRVDAQYSDKRHPDEVKYTTSLKEDLARRDFTINAMALSLTSDRVNREFGADIVKIEDLVVIDPFGGIKDLDAKVIRAVGKAAERFDEDALRLLRAVRLAAKLGFTIEEKTQAALVKQAADIAAVSKERIRDELVKIVMSDKPESGFNWLQQTGLLVRILPELEEGVGKEQNKHHKYTVFEHSIKSLQYAAQYGYSLEVRLAALLHDIGKPRTRRIKGNDFTFYAHDVVGTRMAENVLKRLRFSNEIVKKVSHLVRHHMFYYDVGKVTEAGARRLLRRVGKENFDDLIKLRIAERKGSGVPKAEPYRLRHLQFLVEKAAQEPITVGELAIGGNDLIKEGGFKPSPRLGGVLNALLAEVLDDPAKNKREYLLQRASELKDKDTQELKALGEAAKELEEKKREELIKRKYRV